MKTIYRILSILLLLCIIAVSCFPFILMFFGSFKEDYEIFTLAPKLLPQNGFTLDKYAQLLTDWPFVRTLLNSIIVTGITTLGASFFCTIAGYAFAKFEFPGKSFLFILVLATLMLPLETRLVPTYIVFSSIGGVNKLWSLIVPGLIPAFGVFMMRQFASNGIPTEILEATRIEGASETRILFKITFPMLAPGVFSLAILTFMNTWNEFLWPIIIINNKANLTVTALLRSIGDVSLNGGYGVLLAATTLSALPILILYAFLNKRLVRGIIEGSGK